MQDNQGSSGPPRRRPASIATMRLLMEMEAKFGELVDELDMLGLSLTAARTAHALETFRRETERLTSR